MRTLLTCATILACAACNKAAAPAATADTVAETKAIEAIENAQIAAIGQKDLEGSTALYGGDAVFIGDDGKAVSGKEAITESFKAFLGDPAMKIQYNPGTKRFSSAGDLAYSTASFTETYTDPKTKQPVLVKGTNLSVWRKQADGSWKLVADSNPAGRAE